MAQPVLFLAAMAFDLLPAAICIPTLNMMEQCWVVANGDPFLDPLGTSDANLELIRTCCATFLPFACVDNCLAPMSMRNLWVTIGQPLAN